MKIDIIKKFYLLFLTIVLNKFCFSQNFKIPEGDFMDTTSTVLPPPCIEKNVFYYQIDAKYPESSISLLKKAQSFTSNYKSNFSGSGYISFQFIVDCKGQMLPKIQVLQTDEKYKRIYFDKAFVNQLYTFLKTLDKWKIARINNQEVPLAYHAFLTFKIQNGKVVHIIP